MVGPQTDRVGDVDGAIEHPGAVAGVYDFVEQHDASEHNRRRLGIVADLIGMKCRHPADAAKEQTSVRPADHRAEGE